MASTTEPAGKGGFLTYLLSFVLFTLGWQLLAAAVSAPLILPGPLAVLRRLVSICGTADFYRHIGATMGRVFLAFAITFAAGSVLGLTCGHSRAARQLLSVLLTAVRSIPVVSFILIALFWLGSSAVPVFVAVVMTLPVMMTAVCTGCSAAPRQLLDAASSYRLKPGQLFRHLTLPCLLPFVRDGSISSFGMIWKVVAAGEVLALPKLGTGQLLYTAQLHLESADLLAVTLTIVLLSFSFERGAAALLTLLAGQGQDRRRQASARAAERYGMPESPAENVNMAKNGNTGISQPSKASLPPEILLEGVSAVRSGRPLYRDFTLRFAPASSTAIIAPSGAGKTTLLNFVASLLRPDDGEFSGKVSFGDGTAPPRISFLFQEPCLFPRCTVYENVLLPLLNILEREAASRTALRFLAACGLSGKLSSFPDEMSGGERQRTALARAFAFPSPILLLDEAFQSQDLAQKLSLMRLYEKLLGDCPRTVIFVTHDIREAVSCCSRIIVLKDSPLSTQLDETLSAPKTSFAARYLSPDAAMRSLEQRIAGLLLDPPLAEPCCFH